MRYLLAFFFFVMYAGDLLGLNISLGPGLSFKNLLLYVMFVGIALNAAVARNRAIELPSVFVPFGLLIVYALMTWIAVAFVLSDPEYPVRGSFVRLKSTLVDEYLTLLVFFYGTVHAKDTIWLVRVILWVIILTNVVTVIDTFNVPNLGLVDPRGRDGRFEGLFGGANEYGKFLVLFLPSVVALYLTTTGRARSVAGIGVLVMAIALVFSGTRAAYVGFVAGGILTAFFLRRSISTQMLVRAGVSAVSILAFAIVFVMFSGYTDNLLERFARFGGSAHIATSGRSTIWTNAIVAMIENPLSFVTGYGFSSYESSRFYAATHNTYLNYLYNLGSIGLILFVLTFGRIVATARSVLAHATAAYRPYFVALVCGLFSFLIAIFFSEYHVVGYLMWAYVGVVMRMAMDVRPSDAFEMGEGAGHFSAGSPQKRKPQFASAQLEERSRT